MIKFELSGEKNFGKLEFPTMILTTSQYLTYFSDVIGGGINKFYFFKFFF